jgi:hypothetical protein
MSMRMVRIAVGVAMVAFLGQPASACPACTYALLFAVYPPLIMIACTGLAWCLLNGLWGAGWKGKLRCAAADWPGLIALGILAPFVVWFGLPMALVMLACAIVAWACSFRREAVARLPAMQLRLVRVTGWMAIVVIGGRVMFEAAYPTPHAPVNVILEWDGTGLARGAVRELKKREPHSLPDYREIVRRTSGFNASDAAQRLAVIGDPAIDAPLAIDLLERIAKWDTNSYLTKEIELSLRTMTGLELPESTSAAVWKRAWKERTASPPAAIP